MKKILYLSILLVPALIGQTPTDTHPAIERLLHNRQASLWYSNNFGASSEEHFGVIVPEGFTTRLENHAAESDARAESSIGFAKNDIDFMLGGRVRMEGQLFDRPLTLRGDYNDVYGFVRSKLNLNFTTQYGRRSYGKPAAQMNMRLTAFSIWDDPYLYTPVLSEKVYFQGSNFLKRAEIDEHTHRGVVPLIFLEEGWVRINFDAFLEGITIPASLQVGTFPFIVGRGVALGDYFECGERAFGFERKGDIGNAPHKPVGVLFSVGLNDDKNIFEFYYSKHRKLSHGPDLTRLEVRAKRLDRDETADPRNIERGINSDTDIYAARCGFVVDGFAGGQSLYIEPYGVYINAAELKVEFEADSSLKQGTVGVMAEYSSGNWNANFECAGQYGEQQMYPIDRNHLVLNDAYYTQTATEFGTGLDSGKSRSSAVAGRLDKQIGQPMKYQSHIFIGAPNPNKLADEMTVQEASEYLPYNAYYVSDEMRHINAHRTVDEQGGKIRNASPKDSTDTYLAGDLYQSQKNTPVDSFTNGSLYSQYQFKTGIDYYDTVFGLLGTAPDGTLFNANLPFGAQRRFRQGYTVSNMGIMALFDARYTIPERRLNVSCAFGHIGGGAYPFTTDETDKRTSHFMPLRDGNYVGRYVTSFLMFYPRKFPRPMDMADNDLFAHNNYHTLQNLQFIGIGTQWYPLEAGTVMVEGNAIYFWEVSPPHVWNRSRDRHFQNNTAADKEDSIYRYIQTEQLHFSGSATDELASKNLGLELNCVVSWRPYSSLQFDFRAGLFLPGKLYEDIQGCPNENTRRVDERGEWFFDSLGIQMVSGAQARVTYKF